MLPTRSTTGLFVGALVLSMAAEVVAQDVIVGNTTRRTTSPQRWYRSGGGYGGPGYGYGGYGYSSTPVEGALRGQADVIRAGGEAAESYTNAAINYEEARSRYYDNKLKWAEVYWQRRRLNEAEREVDYDKQRSRRDAWRANNQSRSVARLNPSQLDPTSGKIYWPTVLQGPDFYEYRKKIDELFLMKAQTSPYPGLSNEINQTTLAMKDELKEHIKEMPPNEYLAARKFIEGLGTEVLAPAG